MRIIGIDPGYAIVGYGVVDYRGNSFNVIEYDAVTTGAQTDFNLRLEQIYDGITDIIARLHPEAMSIEKLYFNTNTTTAIDVAQARGVIVLSAAQNGLNISEYTPLQVKQAITGYGRAEKRQVMEMIKSFLNLEKVPKPDDTADALALAVCHANYSGTDYSRLYKEAGR